MENMSGSLVYRDNGHNKDYGRFGKIVNVLKRQPWFIENVAEWFLCDSDDSDSPNDFNEEDLSSHYRKKVGFEGLVKVPAIFRKQSLAQWIFMI